MPDFPVHWNILNYLRADHLTLGGGGGWGGDFEKKIPARLVGRKKLHAAQM